MANDSREPINSQCGDGMTWPGMHSIPIFAIYILFIFVVYIKSASKFFSLSLADSFTLISDGFSLDHLYVFKSKKVVYDLCFSMG